MAHLEIYQPVDNILAYLLIVAVFEALAVYVFQFRKIPGALMLGYCQICKGIWVLARGFASFSPDLATKLGWARFTEWTSLLLIYFWFEFILEISLLKKKLPAAVRYLIQGTVLALVLIIGLDRWLGWYWGPVALDESVLKIAFGPAAWVTLTFCYLLNLFCLGLSVRWICRTNGLQRRQAIAVAVTPLFTLLGNISSHFLPFQVISPQIIGLLFSAVYVTWVFYRWRIYSILPLAQDAVTRNMIDGLMVVDEKGYIVALNAAAGAIFAGSGATVGGKFAAVAAVWPVLQGIDAFSGPEAIEADWHLAGERRFYQISVLPLKTPQGNPLGQTFIFKDITRQKQDQLKMVEQQKALSIMTERDRLGREIHDGQGQIWSYLNMQVEAARSLLDKKDLDQAGALLEKLAGVTREMHVDIRESITGLQLSGIEKQEIGHYLSEYLRWFEQNYQIAVELVISDDFAGELLAPTATVQLLRIIQEALTNVRKYAIAQHVRVAMAVKGHQVEIRVADDGCGFDPALVKKGSFGLKIMRERAAEIGAQFQIESQPGAGTTVILQIPVVKSVNQLKSGYK